MSHSHEKKKHPNLTKLTENEDVCIFNWTLELLEDFRYERSKQK